MSLTERLLLASAPLSLRRKSKASPQARLGVKAEATTEVWAYWCSAPGELVGGIESQAKTMLEAFAACEQHSGKLLDWKPVDAGYWCARAGQVVYSVRYEA